MPVHTEKGETCLPQDAGLRPFHLHKEDQNWFLTYIPAFIDYSLHYDHIIRPSMSTCDIKAVRSNHSRQPVCHAVGPSNHPLSHLSIHPSFSISLNRSIQPPLQSGISRNNVVGLNYRTTEQVVDRIQQMATLVGRNELLD
jgi:hypothetical protein